MTNGEKVQTILDVDRDCTEVHGENGTMTFTVTQDFWNAEYKEPTTKNNLGVDLISRNEVLNRLASIAKIKAKSDAQKSLMGRCMFMVERMPSVTPQPRWISLTKRPMTDEEREYYKERLDVEEAMIFDCPLPEDGQEVLVSYGGYVCVDTFCKDDGCYFEGVDIDDVDAWMPLPAPFEPQESEEI